MHIAHYGISKQPEKLPKAPNFFNSFADASKYRPLLVPISVGSADEFGQDMSSLLLGGKAEPNAATKSRLSHSLWSRSLSHHPPCVKFTRNAK
jgi:hypothetical protein